jgi:hypothetical protein
VAVGWITYLPALWMTHQIGSEPSFMVAWLSALLLLLRGIRRGRAGGWVLFGAGLAIGCASLIRAQGLFVGVVLAVLLVWGLRTLPVRGRATLAAALLAGNLVVVLPWEAYAFAKLGRVIPLSTSGPATLLHGLVFAVYGNDPPGPPPPPHLAELMNALVARKDEFLLPGRAMPILREELGARPATTVELFAWKAARAWYATDSRLHEGPLMLLQAIYLALAASAATLALRRAGARRRMALSIALIVGYFWGMTTLVLSIARYTIPAMPLLFLLLPHLLPERIRSGALRLRTLAP